LKAEVWTRRRIRIRLIKEVVLFTLVMKT